MKKTTKMLERNKTTDFKGVFLSFFNNDDKSVEITDKELLKTLENLDKFAKKTFSITAKTRGRKRATLVSDKGSNDKYTIQAKTTKRITRKDQEIDKERVE